MSDYRKDSSRLEAWEAEGESIPEPSTLHKYLWLFWQTPETL